MNNFLDDDPQDWTNPEYSELHNLLVVCTDTWGVPHLRDLAADAGIAPGTWPAGLGDVRTICRELMRVMGGQGKLRRLVERCAAEPTAHAAEFSAMLTYRPRPAPQALGADVGQTTPDLRRRFSGFRQKSSLVDALLACPTIRDRHTRDTVVDNLSGDIRNNIQRSSADRVDVMNIVTTVLNYQDGLVELVEVVRTFEGDSLPMRDLDRLLS
jgi:hypothetical protein